MVKALILYYLNIKATHGYEIQKFIQTTGVDVWAKIKSGSIYYALSKMESSGDIALVKEETHGSRVRRIYEITEKGRLELKSLLQNELGKDLLPLSSGKFILPMFFNRLEKEKALSTITDHIKSLESSLEYWKYWQSVKINELATEVDKLTFEMTISNIEYSLKWHKALIKDYDLCVTNGQKQEVMIKHFDFEKLDHIEQNSKAVDINKVQQLKDTILNNPETSQDALEELISMLSKGK